MEFATLNYRKRRSTTIYMASLAASIVLSSTAHASLPKPQFNAYGGVSYTNMNLGSVTISPVETDTLDGNSSKDVFTGGVGFSYNFPVPPDTKKNIGHFLRDTSLGADVLFFNTSSSGAVNQYGLLGFNNYNYHLEFQTSRLMLDGTAGLHSIGNDVFPFLKASVGVAAITSKYTETVNSTSFTSGELNLPSHMVYNFAYSLGAGIKKMLTKNLQLAVLYLYTDLGTASTTTHSNSESNITLASPIHTRLKSNAGLIELSVLLG